VVPPGATEFGLADPTPDGFVGPAVAVPFTVKLSTRPVPAAATVPAFTDVVEVSTSLT